MFYSRTTNNKIYKLHERALRLAYDDYVSIFEELLEKDNSFTVHHYKIQTLCIELYRGRFRGWRGGRPPPLPPFFFEITCFSCNHFEELQTV